MTRTARSRTQNIDDKYLALIRAFPLRPLRDDKDLDRAIAVLDALSDRRRPDPLTRDEHDYLMVLGRLVEDYEEEHVPMPPVSGVEMARHLIASRGVTQAQVAAETGLPESALSEVLAGKRTFSTRYVTALARYFNVSADVFLGV